MGESLPKHKDEKQAEVIMKLTTTSVEKGWSASRWIEQFATHKDLVQVDNLTHDQIHRP